mmetsp:Transcript_3050/g.3634  ORF Transcript_3050/g.3634 Transcript_3050/m.3634 type:complete len:169 (-) Transcript_3050:93-599(-)
MACTTSVKEDKRTNSPNKIERLNDREKEHAIKKENGSDHGNTTYDLVSISLGRNGQEKHLQETPEDQPTMIVSLKILRKGVLNKREDFLDGIERKSLAQKELNSVQRKKQIAEYNSLKLKEERQQRYRIRYGNEPLFSRGNFDPSSVSTRDEEGSRSSKRKKRVSFEF